MLGQYLWPVGHSRFDFNVWLKYRLPVYRRQLAILTNID
jgi:hypothetical protein